MATSIPASAIHCRTSGSASDIKTPPRILRLRLLAGARKAEGVAIVIDLMHAFTPATLPGQKRRLALPNP
jgi:hypothetical protein